MAIGGGDGSTKANAITVQTLEDLLTANDNNSQKFIEVTQDINPANEAWYPGFILTQNIKNHIFSNSHHKIVGVCVVGEYITGSTTASTEGTMEVGFHNLEMLNWVFKDTSTRTQVGNVHILSAPSSTKALYFSDCEFSVKLVLNTNTRLICMSTLLYATDCSFYFQFGSGGGIVAPVEGLNASSCSKTTRCNIVFDGAQDTVIQYVGSSSAVLNTVSFVYKNCKNVRASQSSTSQLINNTNAVSMCNTFLNCTYSRNYTCIGSQLHIIATDAPSGTFTSGSANTIIATTVDSSDPDFATTSIKSKDFLISCGFLP